MTRTADNQTIEAEEHLVHSLIDDSIRLLTMTIKTMSSASESAELCSADKPDKAGCIQNKSINSFDLIHGMRQVLNQSIDNERRLS